MIRVLKYSKGKQKKSDLSYSLNKDLAWIHCFNANLNDLNQVAKKFCIPVSELKHLFDSYERPRIIMKKNYSLLILRCILDESKDKKITVPFILLVTKKYVITLTTENPKSLSNLFDNFDLHDWETISKSDFGVLVYTIFTNFLRDYEHYFERLEEDVSELEEYVIKAREKDLHYLFLLRREILFVGRSLSLNKDVIFTLQAGKVPFVKSNDIFHELSAEMLQAVNSVELIRDRITGITDIYFTSTSNKLNEAMKSFTVIASLLLLPMLISGIYGMNVALPLDKQPHAFWHIILIMVASIFLMIFYFNRKKWL